MKKTIASLVLITMMTTLTSGLKVGADEHDYNKEEDSVISETNLLTTNSSEVVNEEDLVEEDKDGDGLVNWLEYYLGTSDNNVDSDGDGLSDYEEVHIIYTDPTLKDSDNNGINDGDEDFDKDGITSLDEYPYGTSPVKSDSDNDGLSDYDEIFNYKTSPILKDTDDDGALDGWEIENGYSPLNYDEAFKVEKEVSSTNEDLSFNVQLNSASGNQVNTLEVTELYEDLDLNDSVPGFLGYGYEIDVNGEIKDLTVSFELKGNVNKTNFEPTIYYFDEEAKELKEVENQVIEGNIIKGDSALYTKYILLNKSEFNKILEEGNLTLRSNQGVTLEKGDSLLTVNEVNNKTSVSIAATTDTTDSDYDGRNDTIDSSPTNNDYNATLSTSYADSSVSYKMDYRWFFQSNTTYKKDLSVVSSLLSSAIYSGSGMNIYDNSGTDNVNSTSIATIMKFHGLTNVEVYKLSSNYSDNDLSEVAIGYRPVTYGGVTKNVISIIVRGTNGTIQEWSSNFDIGDTTKISSYADWTKSTNHKGFDVSANRIITKLNTYLTSKGISSESNVYWVTGHSRGAAIANIIGAKLTDQGKTNYTYTFAAPNTTTASNAANYTSIFNILNEDDFVPYLPMAKWGYKRYGKVATVSIADNYETAWEDLLGKFDYNPDTFGMQDTITKLGAVATNGNYCYKYTCPEHGDGSLDDMTIRNYGMSESSREEAIAKIPTNALPYGKITRYTGFGIAGWDFEVCQTPAYFMQILAAKMAGTISNYRFVVELNVASRYESAKSAIVSSAIGGLEHPHYTETYYLLATKLTSSSF